MSSAPTARFELCTEVTTPAELVVTEWSSSEAICAPFRLELAARVALHSAEEIAARLVGQNAVFAIHDGAIASQARRGTIVDARVEGGLDLEHARVRAVIAPRLSLMDLKVHSRIFQELSVREILARVFGEWRLEHGFLLARTYPKRPYVTQYRETDLELVTRLCAKEGLGFFFEHRPLEDGETSKPGAEKLVVYDDPSFHPAISAPIESSSTSTLVHAAERFDAMEHHVSGFSLDRGVGPELVRLGDFDFRRPGMDLRAIASSEERSPIGEALGGEQLAVYLHAQRADRESASNAPEIDDAVARIRLEQQRDRTRVGRAVGRSPRLSPGSAFTLDGHPISALNGGYVVVRVEHRGRIPEAGHEGQGGAAVKDIYSNSFECVPAGTACHAPLRRAKVQQALETATVVGPKGEEIHCDEHGRVRVQFHWDLDGSRDEKSSCWLRVAQPWAGTNWGAQFIPRIGTEVLVGFLGGDVDQPIVMGSLYNGIRPFPFRFPDEATKSGFRTQSSPGGEGYNELTFDDDKGRERVFVRAERDFEQIVENDYSLTVKNRQEVRIEGASVRTVSGDATTTVLGERNESLGKSYQMQVHGSHALAVNGDSEIRISGGRMTRIEGREQAELFDGVTTTYREDQVARVLGHLITVVGQNDARRSSTLHVEGSHSHFSTGTTEIASDKEIVLRVGKSSVRLTPEGIELVTQKVVLHADDVQLEAKKQIAMFAGDQVASAAKNIDLIADERVRVKGKKAQVQLDDNARVDGQLVKLNCQPDPVDETEVPAYEPPKPTKIKLTDEDGNPLPARRFVVIAGDGTERSGMLDEQGEAEIFLEESGQVVFPDVDNPRTG